MEENNKDQNKCEIFRFPRELSLSDRVHCYAIATFFKPVREMNNAIRNQTASE